MTVRSACSRAAGSSPLTRGKPLLPGGQVRGARLIPAHAGKTRSCAPSPPTVSAHPRSRGENAISRPSIISVCGSSPLTRGKHVAVIEGHLVAGLIPAHAGKTLTSPRGPTSRAAHPRSRGENVSIARSRSSLTGSSPLTRGKRDRPGRGARTDRLIPAHAGKTHPWRPTPLSRPAHPRSRGENRIACRGAVSCGGSSPLTRGKPGRSTMSAPSGRLIPAHAGKTSMITSGVGSRPAHPRSRGENQLLVARALAGAGSSPLTRGKPIGEITDNGANRLIPAHAGKTHDTCPRRPPPTAHPRSRGENLVAGLTPKEREGSSPLTRGKPGAVMSASRTSRLIPAHAGKTGWRPRPMTGPRAHPRSRGENPPSLGG